MVGQASLFWKGTQVPPTCPSKLFFKLSTWLSKNNYWIRLVDKTHLVSYSLGLNFTVTFNVCPLTSSQLWASAAQPLTSTDSSSQVLEPTNHADESPAEAYGSYLPQSLNMTAWVINATENSETTVRRFIFLLQSACSCIYLTMYITRKGCNVIGCVSRKIPHVLRSYDYTIHVTWRHTIKLTIWSSCFDCYNTGAIVMSKSIFNFYKANKL